MRHHAADQILHLIVTPERSLVTPTATMIGPQLSQNVLLSMGRFLPNKRGCQGYFIKLYFFHAYSPLGPTQCRPKSLSSNAEDNFRKGDADWIQGWLPMHRQVGVQHSKGMASWIVIIILFIRVSFRAILADFLLRVVGSLGYRPKWITKVGDINDKSVIIGLNWKYRSILQTVC